MVQAQDRCHYPDWKFTATDAVCDSSFHGRLFVGERRSVRPGQREVEALLKACEVSLYRGDVCIEVGRGQNVLGSPLLAVTSLVEAIQREGSRYPILPGELITTGTLTKAYPIKAGERWRTEFGRGEFPALMVDFV